MIENITTSSPLIGENLTASLDTEIIRDPNSYSERVVVGLLILCICIFGIVGNAMVTVAVLLSRKLQTPSNAFVVTLAFADLITCVANIWNVVALLLPNGRELQDRFERLTAITTITATICIGVSFLTLAAISINRYILITKSRAIYQIMYSPVKISLMLSAIIVIPFSFQISVEFLENESLLYIVYKFAVMPLALITISASYYQVYRHVTHHFKRMRQQEVNDRGEQAANTYSKGDLEITKNLLIVVVVFILCFIPHFILLFVPGPEREPYRLYGTAILYVNTCINPIIYARRHPIFKVVLGALITLQYQNIPEPSGLLKRFWTNRIHPNL